MPNFCEVTHTNVIAEQVPPAGTELSPTLQTWFEGEGWQRFRDGSIYMGPQDLTVAPMDWIIWDGQLFRRVFEFSFPDHFQRGHNPHVQTPEGYAAPDAEETPDAEEAQS